MILTKRGPSVDRPHSIAPREMERGAPYRETGAGRAAHPRSLHIDFETRSVINLTRSGVYPYATHPTTDVLVARYAFDDGPIQEWTRVDWFCPDDIARHVMAGGEIWAHNAAFERALWWGCLVSRYGWPKPRREQFHCTAAVGAALSLPRSLDGMAQALGLATRKDNEGRRLMLKMCKPLALRPDGTPIWYEPPGALERLSAYCAQDVATERAIHKTVLPLPAAERAVYLLDQHINDRGIAIDVPLITAALRLVDQQMRHLDEQLWEASGWRLGRPTQVARIKEWAAREGVEIESLAKKPLGDLLDDPELPEHVRAVLEVRKEAAKSSTAKLTSLLECVDTDGAIRGMLLYHAAGTGRWAGRLAQVHNFPRGTGLVKKPEEAIPYIRLGDAATLRMLWGRPLDVVSDCLRSMLVARPGRRLMAGDYANIEGRENAWLAGEEWKLRAFGAYDRGDGEDLYCIAAGAIFGRLIDPDEDKAERQVGKVAELALGYQGGVKAFVSMAVNYPGTDKALVRVSDALWLAAPKAMRERVQERFDETGGMDVPWVLFRAIEVTKRRWRDKHPSIVTLWHELERAAIAAVQDPGAVKTCGRVAFRYRLGFLWMRLPSGRSIAYASPKVTQAKTPWDTTVPKLTVMGVNPKTKQWVRESLYGGKLCENAVQGIARDVMVAGMLELEAAGYPVILTVHDEIVTEPDNGFGGLREFTDLMTAAIPWNTGCPVAAKAWEGPRYRKD